MDIQSQFLGTGARYGLLAFPPDDAYFARYAARQIERVRTRQAGIGAARRDLRARYPVADLYRQDRVLVQGGGLDVWLAFREGRSSPLLSAYAWWRKRGTARALVSASGRLSGLNRAFRSLLGVRAGNGMLLMARSFLPSGLCDELGEGSARLPAESDGAGSDILDRPGEEQEQIEYRVGMNEAGPGRHRLAIRTFAERDRANEDRAVRASGLAALPRHAQRSVLEGASRRELSPGEQLTEAVRGEPWVVLVVAGITRLYLMTDHADSTLYYGRPGSLLGTHWPAAEEPFATGLQAVTPATLLMLDAGLISRLATTDARFTRAVSQEGRGQLSDLVVAYAMRTSASLSQRLAWEVLRLRQLHPSETFLPVTEQQLAEGVGSIRESVGRSIGDLRRMGVLATTRYGVIVLDADALGKLAAEGLRSPAPAAGRPSPAGAGRRTIGS